MSERLTKRKDYGCACWNGDQNLVTHRRYSEMLEALAKYEDVIFDADGNEVISLKELAQLLEDKREGRVAVLPCKVTDLLYVIYSPKHPANPSDKGKRFMATAQVNRIKLGAKGFSMETWMGSFSESEIGKTVFLTQAEAARALSSAGEGAE